MSCARVASNSFCATIADFECAELSFANDDCGVLDARLATNPSAIALSVTTSANIRWRFIRSADSACEQCRHALSRQQLARRRINFFNFDGMDAMAENQ